MTDANHAADDDTVEYIPFDEFRLGLPHGRFRVIVNPALAHRFVSQRVHATPVAIAVIGCGIASALAGHAVIGALLVLGGVLLRRALKWQAGKILLHLASRHPATYDDATRHAVMEVRRVG